MIAIDVLLFSLDFCFETSIGRSKKNLYTLCISVRYCFLVDSNSSSQPDGVVDKKDRTQCSSQSLTNKRNVRKKKNRKVR